jgi:hypothetical protein
MTPQKARDCIHGCLTIKKKREKKQMDNDFTKRIVSYDENIAYK